MKIFNIPALAFLLFAFQLPRCVAQENVYLNEWTSPNGTIWKGATRAPDGTVWSDILPGYFANCISKNTGAVRENGFVVCKRDAATDILEGTSADGKTVINSDAIEACKAVGGQLPSINDVLLLTQNRAIANMERTQPTSTIYGNLELVYAYSDDSIQAAFYPTSRLDRTPVRCISKP